MRVLSNVELLDVWEAGLAQTAVERALALMAVAEPDVPVEDLARLTVGQRDLRLFLLRKATFGDTLPVIVACPVCGEQAEASVDIDGLLLHGAPEHEACVDCDGYSVRFRVPNSGDLAALPQDWPAERAAIALLAACVIEAQCDGQPVEAGQLPDSVIAAVGERMTDLDPQADIELAFNCPSCETPWLAPLDIVSFFWSEIDAWAQRTMHDVHALASAYRWSERDILAMSARRRRTYLDMIGD